MDPRYGRTAQQIILLVYFLNKASKGGYADYSTSTWARRERPLSDAEMQAVNTHGLFNFNDFRQKFWVK